MSSKDTLFISRAGADAAFAGVIAQILRELAANDQAALQHLFAKSKAMVP